MASLISHKGGMLLRGSFAALMLLVVTWTAWHFETPEKTEIVNVQQSPVVASRDAAKDEQAEREKYIRQLVAEVALVCPASAVELERELRASPDGKTLPDYRLMAYKQQASASPQASASITSIRVAQRPEPVISTLPKPPRNWLVDPNSWYVPEDAASMSVTDQVPLQGELPQPTPPVIVDPPIVESAVESVEQPAIEVVGPTVSTEQSAEPVENPYSSGAPRTIKPRRIAPPPVDTNDSVASDPVGEQGPSLTGPQIEPNDEPTVDPKESQPELVDAEPIVEKPQTQVLPDPVPSPAYRVPKRNENESATEEPEKEPSSFLPPPKPVAPPVEEMPLEELEDSSFPGKPTFAPPVVIPPNEIETPDQEPVTDTEDQELPEPTSTEGSTREPVVTPLPAPTPSQAEPNLHQPASDTDREAAWAKAREAGVPEGVDPHFELVAEGCFPSAKTCAKCHEKIYKEWSCSSHAYAHVSPMFQKFEQRITEVSQGTIGYFCMRCHSPVGTTLGIPRDVPIWKQPAVAREGITCVACHRVNQRYVKTNGERRLVPGDIYAPIYGGKGGVGVEKAIAQKDHFKIKISPEDKGPGQPIHLEGRYFDQLSKAEYCTTCHQVAVHPGIKLEVVWEQYRASPAYRQGITCQDCHMGKVPGVPSGYECSAIAEVGGKKVRENVKHSNHVFYGPGYSIAHPGVFPFHMKADRWTMKEWLEFDWRAGWGTDDFEDRVADGEIRVNFPEVWKEVDDRYDAREIIEDNQKLLATKTEIRKQVMENGSHIDGPFFKQTPTVGRDLNLHYVITNTNTGHNLLTASLGAQPQFWANVVLIGPRGQRLWETGYTDRFGDVCDIHSRDVRAGRVPFDSQLFNLQTMFLITGAVGTDREFYLPVNVDFDQLPFLRPGAIPVSVTNHPPFIRMESRSLAPLGKKKIKYRIPGKLLCEPGRYRLSFRMRSRAEPIYFMDFCRATTEMTRAMNEGIIDVHPYAVEFEVR